MHDISAYLREHEPFTGLDPEIVAQIAERVEIEFFAAGDTIFRQGESPAERVRIVVSGAVELLDGDRLLDLLGPGEMFGHSLTRRVLERLSQKFPGLPPLMWLTTGSFGREEAFPSSDIDCAIAWEGTANAGDELRALAEQVLEVLAQCRFATDTHAVSAAHPLFARSAAGWRAAISRWLTNPDDDRLVVVISILADRRPVDTVLGITDPFAELSEVHRHPLFLRNLRRLALANRPPTGFLRDIVLESSGQHRGQFDIKTNGFMPIVGVGRYIALAHGISETGTISRLKAAADSGALPLEDAAGPLRSVRAAVGASHEQSDRIAASGNDRQRLHRSSAAEPARSTLPA